jgi:hypothetical protein
MHFHPRIGRLVLSAAFVAACESGNDRGCSSPNECPEGTTLERGGKFCRVNTRPDAGSAGAPALMPFHELGGRTR